MAKFKAGDKIQFKTSTVIRYTIASVHRDHYINLLGHRMDMSYTDSNFELVKEEPLVKEETIYTLNGLMQQFIKEGKDDAEQERRYKAYKAFFDTLEDDPEPTEKKPTIVDDLRHYLATTPKEELERKWEELKEWGKVGPTVSEFLGWKQPVCEGLEEVSEALAEQHGFVKNPNCKPAKYSWSAVRDVFIEGVIAGASWQKEQMISALKNGEELPTEFIDKFHEIDRTAFQNGQKNMKEQMMKEAVEGEVECFSDLSLPEVSVPLSPAMFKVGDKVKFIIINPENTK